MNDYMNVSIDEYMELISTLQLAFPVKSLLDNPACPDDTPVLSGYQQYDTGYMVHVPALSGATLDILVSRYWLELLCPVKDMLIDPSEVNVALDDRNQGAIDVKFLTDGRELELVKIPFGALSRSQEHSFLLSEIFKAIRFVKHPDYDKQAFSIAKQQLLHGLLEQHKEDHQIYKAAYRYDNLEARVSPEYGPAFIR